MNENMMHMCVRNISYEAITEQRRVCGFGCAHTTMTGRMIERKRRDRETNREGERGVANVMHQSEWLAAQRMAPPFVLWHVVADVGGHNHMKATPPSFGWFGSWPTICSRDLFCMRSSRMCLIPPFPHTLSHITHSLTSLDKSISFNMPSDEVRYSDMHAGVGVKQCVGRRRWRNWRMGALCGNGPQTYTEDLDR